MGERLGEMGKRGENREKQGKKKEEMSKNGKKDGKEEQSFVETHLMGPLAPTALSEP